MSETHRRETHGMASKQKFLATCAEMYDSNRGAMTPFEEFFIRVAMVQQIRGSVTPADIVGLLEEFPS